MTDLAAEGDRLHAESAAEPDVFGVEFAQWAEDNWPAVAAALRERDTLNAENDRLLTDLHTVMAERDAALRTVDEREAYAATRDERITELLRERDELVREAEIYRGALVHCNECDALRVRAETLQADLAAANQDLADLWAWVDYEGTRSKESLRRAHRPRLAAHAAAVEGRHAG